MIIKLVLLASLFTLSMGNSLIDRNQNLVYKPYYGSKTQVNEYKVKYTQGLFKVNDFAFGYIGQEASQDYHLSYVIYDKFYTYDISLSYSDSSGDDIDIYENYYDTGFAVENMTENIDFTLEADTLERPYVSFDFRINVIYYSKSMIQGTIVSRQRINFYLTNYMTEVRASSAEIRLPYYIEYDGDLKTGTIYYDSLTFREFNSTINELIYFRIKPSNFTLECGGTPLVTDVKFVIKNNNGSFDDVITKTQNNEDYFLLVPSETGIENVYKLDYKSIRNGGDKNLYLDPYSMNMRASKTSSDLYEVTNFYLPREKDKIYDYLDCSLIINGYGSNSVVIKWNFKITFDKTYIEDYYYPSMDLNKVKDNSASNEVLIP